MKPYYSTPDGRAKLYLGDARQLPVEDESIDMISTSPPYWGKRDYGEDVVAIWDGEDGCEHEWSDGIGKPISGGASLKSTLATNPTTAEKTIALREGMGKNESAYCSLCGAWRGQLGLEPTWQEYIAHLCECAEEWWRVLKPTGNLFVNMGDTFATHTSKRSAQFDGDIQDGRNLVYTRPRPKQNYPEKSKLGIPYRLRFALNDMGWVSRDDIIWYKGKEYPDGKITKVAMPESVKDRMSCSYEMLFHLVKEPKGYFFDLDAVRARQEQSKLCSPEYGKLSEHNTFSSREGNKSLIYGTKWSPKQRQYNPAGKNPGDVLIIQPEPFKEAHYAVWPSRLCEFMIKVGCPKEVCPKCGKPRERMTHTEYEVLRKSQITAQPKVEGQRETSFGARNEGFRFAVGKAHHHTIGWSDCGCGEGFIPGVVLDPFFGGSGRIAERALYLGRNVIGVDMKEEYLDMAKNRLLQGVLL